MTYFFKKITISFLVSFLTASFALAANISVVAPEKTLTNRQPIDVQVFLDTGKDTLSGLSGDFSFPSDMFTVSVINVEESVVSLWLEQPKISEEKYLDGRTHIIFEGIFPGGYDGVRSPYYNDKRPGIIFSIRLIPKNKGVGSFVVDNIAFHKYDSVATPIPSTLVAKKIIVPQLLFAESSPLPAMQRVKSSSLDVFVSRSPLINNNAWYLIINEGNEKSAVEKIEVAETEDYSAELVDSGKWRTGKSSYVLFYQDRSKFIHVKITYSNNTYTTVTLPPVENSKSFSSISRILLSVVCVLFLLLYGKNFITSFYKKI